MINAAFCSGTSGRLVRASALVSQQSRLASNLPYTVRRGPNWINKQWSPRSHSRSANRLSRLSVQAAWGDDIVWSPAKIVKTQKAADGFQSILLEVGSKAAKAYTTAGQYLQVRLKGSKPGFYAIASAPHESKDGIFELLIRRRGENSEELAQAKEGTEVEASPVDGPGFRIDKVGPETVSQVLIFATGSGIAPIKALIESGNLQAQKRKSAELYWGTQNPDATPFRSELKDWESHGIKVNHVYSKDGLGYVQDVFEQENAFQDGSKVAVILCGHKDMSDIISKQMQGAGVQKERILTNY